MEQRMRGEKLRQAFGNALLLACVAEKGKQDMKSHVTEAIDL